MTTIRTEVDHKNIIYEQVYYIFKVLIIVNTISVLGLLFTQEFSFEYPLAIVNTLLFLLFYEYHKNKRSRMLLSVSIHEDLCKIEFLHLFKIKNISYPIKSLSMKYFYKVYGKTALLTFELKSSEKFVIEIREDEEYGWDSIKRNELINLLSPPASYVNLSDRGKKVKFLGITWVVEK